MFDVGHYAWDFPYWEAAASALSTLSKKKVWNSTCHPGIELGPYLGNPAVMTSISDVLQLRVRYSETDQMGTFYNSRALEWFECARTELMRRTMGMSYVEMETKGFFLPLVEAHLEYQGGARYDDLLNIHTKVAMSGRAKLHFEVHITQNYTGKPVVKGYTVHAFADENGRAVRPPAWFLELLHKSAAAQAIKAG